MCVHVYIHIRGLQSKPELNGMTVQVVAYVPDIERFIVQLDGGEQIRVKLGCLHAIASSASSAGGDSAPMADLKRPAPSRPAGQIN